jgi:LmbE family N-acetylglucosaminyl deacetylase
MRGLPIARKGEKLSVLCLGAHSDDIEIGVGGTLLALINAGVKLNVHWCVLSGREVRHQEARASALDFLEGAETHLVEIADFDDSFFPAQSRQIKEWLSAVRGGIDPDVVFTHRRDDAHQDHREVSGITWNLFRDHLILEYEIPKWDGDLGQPNFYSPLSREELSRKIELLSRHFGSQRSKDWFDEETFRGLARLRGMECRAPCGYAEAFFLHKAALSLG